MKSWHVLPRLRPAGSLLALGFQSLLLAQCHEATDRLPTFSLTCLCLGRHLGTVRPSADSCFTDLPSAQSPLAKLWPSSVSVSTYTDKISRFIPHCLSARALCARLRHIRKPTVEGSYATADHGLGASQSLGPARPWDIRKARLATW